jgi:hypothetical protein
MKKMFILCALTLTFGVLMAGSALAAAQITTSPVYAAFGCTVGVDCEVVGTSQLVRTNNGMNMTFQSGGLEPGTVATIWWVIFNNPEECVVPGNCGAADVFNPDQVQLVDISVFYAAGHVIGGSGKANYGAHIPVGKLTVNPDQDANQLIIGDGILKNAMGAEVHLVLRTHGPKIPHMVHQQVKTFDAGCTTAPPALQGPNTCQNLQFSVHYP